MPILRITRGKIQPGTWDQFEAGWHKAVEQLGRYPGIVSRSLVRNIDDPNEGYAMSVWENLEALESYEKSALAKTVTPMMKSFFTGDYQSHHCEILYWEMKA